MAKGHALLIPKAPGCVSILDMPADDAANVLRELPRLAKAVQAATGCDGVNVVSNAMPAAGQVVFHVHFHVIPRFENDGGVVRLGAHGASSKMIDPEDAKAIGDAIRAAL
jgi:histidine triad (HIT) family protein